jgi:hypothetical protein
MHSSPPPACYMSSESHLPSFYHSNYTWHRVKLWNSLCSFLQPPVTSSLFGPNILLSCSQTRSRDSVVCIATGYGLDDPGFGVLVPVASRISSSPRRPDRLWGPPSILCGGYRTLFLREQSGRGVKLTTHLQLGPKSGKCGSIYPLPHTPSWRSV